MSASSSSSPESASSLLQSPEELRVVRQWQKDAFWNRCLPFSVASGAITSYLIGQGRLSPHPRFGRVPKVLGASVLGYFIGKLSYMNVLRDRLLQQAPDGELAKRISEVQRQAALRQQGLAGSQTDGYLDSTADNVSSQDALGINSNASNDANTVGTKQSSGLNYDDLRRRNRSPQTSVIAPPSKGDSPSNSGSALMGEVPPDAETPPSKLRRPKVNKYGDEIYE